MKKSMKEGCAIIPADVKPWPHELRVAQILAVAGHVVEFLSTSNVKTADVLVDGVEFEIKSPLSGNANSLEHVLKKALKQSPNIIIDTARIKKTRDDGIKRFLVKQMRTRKQIKKLTQITKRGQIIDIGTLI